MKVVEDVPYVYGLDKWIGSELNDENKGYLKDFGAATASNGAVGLYHIDNLTPEAKELGEKLIVENPKVYVIDDAELERVYKSYPNMWKKPDSKPTMAFVGCPHLTFTQLNEWTDMIEKALKQNGKKKVALETIVCSAPDVVENSKKLPHTQDLSQRVRNSRAFVRLCTPTIRSPRANPLRLAPTNSARTALQDTIRRRISSISSQERSEDYENF